MSAPPASAPVHMSNVWPCRGHTTTRSSARPSASGPPLCGHTASIARSEPSRSRNTAICSPSTGNERVGAHQPIGVLPVVLQEPAGERDDGVGVVDGGEKVTLADVRARRAADIDLPSAVTDGDDAKVLAQRLRAVARTTRDGQL